MVALKLSRKKFKFTGRDKGHIWSMKKESIYYAVGITYQVFVLWLQILFEVIKTPLNYISSMFFGFYEVNMDLMVNTGYCSN